MIDDPIALMKGIKALIESLPRPPDELGFAGETEQRIAAYYKRLGDYGSAGDWWVRAALEAEKYNQITDARIILEVAVKEVPEHVGIRRELKRISDLIERLE